MNTLEIAIALLQPDQPATDQQAACKMLASLKSPAAIRALLNALPTEDPHVFEAVVAGLVSINAEEASNGLIAVLKQEDAWGIRHRIATHALGQLGDPSSITVLAQLASKHHWNRVREAAAKALGNFPHPEALGALPILLADSDYAVQCAAATSLGVLAEKGTTLWSTMLRSTATEALCEALLKPDPWGLLQTASVVALKSMQDPIAIPSLLTLLQRPANPALLTDQALNALVSIGRSTTSSLLRILPRVDKDTQAAISKAFRLTEPKLAEIFPGALYGEEKELDVLESLLQAGDIRTLSTLVARIQQLDKASTTGEEIVKQRLIDTLKKVQHIKPEVLCEQDFTRFISSSQNRVPYYACRTCGESYYAINISHVIAVLQKDAPASIVHNSEHLRVNWLKKPIMIDFDEVEIGDASNEEILRFCVMVGNDTDLFRKSKVRCTINSSRQLSPNTIRVLDKTFDLIK